MVGVFTGLVHELGTVTAVDATDAGARLTVATTLPLAPGDSVAVNGVCLTATTVPDGAFTADVMHETLRHSSLAGLEPDGKVNLELPLRADARLGGHFVQGHVDGLGTIWDTRDEGFARVVTVGAPPEILRYVVHKGSIAVDGVSLTVSGVGDDWLQVSLIPETLERTILGSAEVSQKVNLEVDVLAKYVERLVAR